jgi:hypothetical protein
MVQILEYTEGNIIAAKASKTLVASDYHKLLPLFVHRLKQYSHIRLYLDVTDLQGLALDELREDMGFNTGLASVFDKVALVGDNKSEPWLRNLSEYFISAEVNRYDSHEKTVAIDWLRQNRRNVRDLIPTTAPATADILR